MTQAQRAFTTPAPEPHDQPLDLHVERFKPFTWVNTLYSLVIWPPCALVILFWASLFFLLDKTFVPGREMFWLPKIGARLTLPFAGIWLRCLGLDKLDRSRPYVFAVNHVSMADAPVMAAAMPVRCRAIQEESHLKIPVYGTFVKSLGEVLVDRKDKVSVQRAFAQALAMLRAGDSFLLFPEGMRTRDGRLGRFYPGAFRLAIDADVPVIPVAIKGLRNVNPAGEWRGRPGVVTVIFGDPIEPGELAGEAGAEQLGARARHAINELLKR